ncbi:putative bacteriodes thetaiotaomicron symbiotic chitinase [Diplodia seriata]|uniref:Putative bacteriodes thetaiotaomicron symbiotic chitinase n=1 Tax=Diplodia seriata TaxID=420778 RepID=A0A0G2EK01_9PEZI|nr:putative bacteriodes thetaiotaomicron symbiotic chitinase [Diplodia seriata]
MVFWLLLLFGLILSPGADSRALAADNDHHDNLVHTLANITKLIKGGLDHSCDISACDIDQDLCHNDDNEGGDDYDDECDEDNLDDCPAEQVDTTDTTAGGRRQYSVNLQSGFRVDFQAMPYPTVGKVLKKAKNGNDMTWPFALQPEDLKDCTNTAVVGYQILSSSPPALTVTEHILELQSISMWMTMVTDGKLARVDDACFSDFWTKPSLPSNVPKMESGTFKTSTVPNDRVFEALGSFRNRGVFLIADYQVNAVKTRIWSGSAIFHEDKVAELLDNAARLDEDAGKALGMIILPVLVFDYLNNIWTRERLWQAINGVAEQLQLIENNIPQCSGVAASWNLFIPSQLNDITSDTKDWIVDTSKSMILKVKGAADKDPNDAVLQARYDAVKYIIKSLLHDVGEKLIPPGSP